MPETRDQPQKNVLILHSDQQRADSLGCMGNPYAVTPNLDRLAAEGSLFTRHISANTVCMPSRASLMTGLYPPGHNVWSNGIALNRKVYAHTTAPPGSHSQIELTVEPPTMADVFARAGYDTVSFGKLHLTPNLAPLSYGYHETWAAWDNGSLDEWHGPYYGFRYVDITKGHGESPCTHGHYAKWLKAQYPEVIQAVAENQAHKTLPIPSLGDLYASPLPAELHHSAWLADRFCNYLDNERPDDAPFFAFVGFPDPHHPFTPCADTLALFEDIEVKDPTDPTGEGIAGSPLRDCHGRDISRLSLEERRTIIRYTTAMIYQIDRAVGKIIDTLKTNGLWEDTIVVFTSDHGDYLGDHGRLRKGEAGSNSLLQLPFILRAPGSELPNRVNAPMSNCDVLPTLAALTGVQPPNWQHGRDIAQVLQNDEEHCAVAWCSNGRPEWVNYSVYSEDYRLSYAPYWRYIELFDHRMDPGECRNVADEQPGQAAELLVMLQEKMLDCYNPILGRTCAW